MSKLMALIRRAPKRFTAVLAMAAAAVVVPAVVFAWGPDRPTFTGANPAPYVTFNSITDNPDVGDERNFVRIREAGTGNYGENVSLQPGKTYDVMVYFHNNAKDSLNASGEGIAHNTMLRMQMAANVAANSETKVTGFINSPDAEPVEVYDSATLTNPTNGAMDLSFVAKSAKVTSNGGINGSTLPDSVFSSGAKLGYDSQDGKVPGCNEYAGYVVFQVKAHQPNFTVTKQVQKNGETGWKDSVDVKPGDTVNYLVTYKNTGTTNQLNVVLKDTLPEGMTYVSGTTYVANTANPQGLLLDAQSDTVTTTGANIGNYGPGAAAYVKYTAKVAANDKLPKCGANTLTNKAVIQTDNGSKNDTADVTVTKECKPEAKYTCDALKVEKVDRTNFKFTTTYTVQNATFKGVTYVIRNASGAVVDTKTEAGNTATYTQTTPGSFTVQASIIVTVDGQDKTVSSNGCKGSFKVEELPKDIKVCELATKKIITIKETDFDSSKHSKNLDDCKEVEVKKIKVCELETKKIITIKETDFDSSKHSKNLDDCKEVEVKKIKVCELDTKKIITIKETDFDATKHSKNLDDCKEVEVKEIEVCELKTKEIITIKETDFDGSLHSKDLDNCKEEEVKTIKVCEIDTKKIVTINEKDFDDSKHTKDLTVCETTPPELPQTGAAENIVAIVGLGAIAASIAYYVASRRALNQ